MRHLRKFIEQGLIFCLITYIISFSAFEILLSEEIKWTEVAIYNDEIQFIDKNSIKYNNKGFLSVITKYSKINLDDQSSINSNSYLIAIDCGNRLYSKLPLNSGLKQVREWTNPINNKLIKQTIIKTCSY